MAATTAHTLPKAERLCGVTAIASLLRRGRYSTASCIRYCYAPNGLDRNRILVSVPKRAFKRAVRRNLLKRRIRESYRLQKEKLIHGAATILIYTAREVLTFAEIYEAVGAVLETLEAHGAE